MAKAHIGPLQLLVFGFDEPSFDGKIIREVDKLNQQKLLRLVDGLVVYKDKRGKLTSVEGSQVSLKQATEYGAIIGGLIGIGTGDEKVAKAIAKDMGDSFHDRYEYGLAGEDIQEIAEELPKDSAALLILVEHLWAIPLRDAMRGAGGMLVAQDFLSPEALVAIGQNMRAHAIA